MLAGCLDEPWRGLWTSSKCKYWAVNCALLGCKNVVLLYHSFCCILSTCLDCNMRLVITYYICTYISSRKLSLLQQLSLQHVMVSELCTDFTATLHLSPGLYSSYSRLSSFMSILYVICTSSDFWPHARLPCILLSFVTFHFTPLLSQIIPCISNAGSHSSSCSFRFTRQLMGFGKRFIRPFEVLYKGFRRRQQQTQAAQLLGLAADNMCNEWRSEIQWNPETNAFSKAKQHLRKNSCD